MSSGYYVFAILLALSSAIAACVAVLIWQRRGRAGAGYLAGSLAAMAFYSFATYLEMVTVRPETKILWSKIAYLPELPSITFLLLFALVFAEIPVSARTQRWLWAPAVLVIVLAWTNDWHGWVWPGFAPGPAGSNTLIYFHGPAWWAKVVWEYAQLASVMGLFLWRAIHYTPSPGWVEVQISRAAQAGRAGVAIEVRDSGEGISGEDLPHLFERFYRGHAALVCGVPGLGMGLASCRATIERLGGRVSARSTPGSGSCFSVWLPACAPEATLLRQTL